MRRPRTPFLFLLAALLPLYAAEPFEDHDKAHGRPQLARLGTIGDRPPLESTLVVHVHADGAIRIDGKETTLDGLSGPLTALVETKREPAVLLRADERLPWKAMQFLLIVCAEHKVYRVFHAVLPERGDDEGAFYWPLPRDQSPPRGEPAPRVDVRIALGGSPASPAHLYHAAREAKVAYAQLKLGVAVPVGDGLRAADALCRAGVRTIDIYGTQLPTRAERAADLRPLVKDLAGQKDPPGASTISIRFSEEELGAAKAEPMPAVDRVIGGFAGPGDEQRERGFDPKARAGRAVRKEAVQHGLAWLAAHQDEDGRWDADGFMKHDPPDDRCDGAGGPLNDVGVTALSVLAFLGAGYTDRGDAAENKYAENVRSAARFLLASQTEDGAFGSREPQAFIYNHAMATLAVCELLWMTRNPRYKKPAQDGLDYLAAVRNPYAAWRYRPRGGDSDTSVTIWCVMALKSGKYAGLEVDPDCFEGARQWIDHVTDPETGRVGYLARGGPSFRPKEMEARWPASQTNAMTAAGVLGRVFLGEDPRTSDLVQKGAQLCADKPPTWNPDTGTIDMDYWYFGTLALFQVGGRKWDAWSKAMDLAIIRHQHQKGAGSRTGSWDPMGPWGPDGGRVHATALMTMALEVYYRYDRVFPAKR